jgi:methionyl-tRNA synthetase
MNGNCYLTTSIPYVNGDPHLGHALEFVHADVLARWLRERGRPVRLQSGSDDHAIKNVSAAAAHGVPISEYVARNGTRFQETAVALGVCFDEFLRTSSDPRHRPGVEALWAACSASGDLYEKDYSGLYCAGCEQFYSPEELLDGLCREHLAPPVEVTESNWFFRLSRYRRQITDLVTTGALLIEPAERRNEVLGFLRGDVHDLSVSRPVERAEGWGIPVPGDPEQIVYVWFDALTNYITGLGYGTDDEAFNDWWAEAAERVHVVGKGIVRFHAVYWIAFLLSAGLPLPTRIYVHDYLTVNGAKIAKSGAQAADPTDLAARYGQDAVRWWLLRDPARVGETDFTEARLVDGYNRDLANGVGNLVSRVLTLNNRPRTWERTEPDPLIGESLTQAAAALRSRVDEALSRYDYRAATEALCAVADEANRFIEAEAPWHLAQQAVAGDSGAAGRHDAVLVVLVAVCRIVARELRPFIPAAAARLLTELAIQDRRPRPVLTRIA